MGRLFWLSDRQFELIKPHLDRTARRASVARMIGGAIISGIIHVLQSALPLAGLPAGVRAIDDGLQPL